MKNPKLLLAISLTIGIGSVTSIANAHFKPHPHKHGGVTYYYNYKPGYTFKPNYGYYKPSHNYYDYGYYDNYGYDYYDNYDYGYNNTSHSGTVYTSCAPNMIRSNVQATDDLVSSYLLDKKFQDKTKFKNKIESILSIKDDGKRLSKYFTLVNVYTAKEIAHFVGAREDNYVFYGKILAHNTGISTKLATEIVRDLIKTLKNI